MAKVTEIIQGNLGRIGELRELNGGNAVLGISVVVTPRVKKNNEWVDDESIWTDVTLWGDVARNFVASNLKAGTALTVIGTRRARRAEAYTAKDGTEVPERVVQSVNADSVAVDITRWTVVNGTSKVNSGNGAATAASAGAAQPAQPAVQPAQPAQPATASNPNDIFGDGAGLGTSATDIFGDGF